jgi:hypothetical protein
MNDIPLHSRVALIDGADNVYTFALAGTEGWIRERKIDDLGYDLVKIEWDKDHWRYNGQPDGWTFETHFKAIGPPEVPAEKTEDKQEDDEKEENEPQMEIVPVGEISLTDAPPADHQIEVYIDTLTEAMDAASESEAFLMIAVRRVPNPENPRETMYVPQIFTTSTTQEGALLLDIQLAECASTSYEEMVFQLIEQLKKHDGR